MNAKVLGTRSDATGTDDSCDGCIILIDSNGFVNGMANREEKVTEDLCTLGGSTVGSNFRVSRMERDRG